MVKILEKLLVSISILQPGKLGVHPRSSTGVVARSSSLMKHFFGLAGIITGLFDVAFSDRNSSSSSLILLPARQASLASFKSSLDM